MPDLQLTQILRFIEQWVFVNPTNTAMFVGLIAVMGVLAVSFYIYGIIINLYPDYDIECKSWFWTACKYLSELLLLWILLYMIVMLFSSQISFLHFVMTIAIAFCLSFIGAMLLALVYYVLFYCVLSPLASLTKNRHRHK